MEKERVTKIPEVRVFSNKKKSERSFIKEFVDYRIENKQTKLLRAINKSSSLQCSRPLINASRRIVKEMQPKMFNRGNVMIANEKADEKERIAHLAMYGKGDSPWTLRVFVKDYAETKFANMPKIKDASFKYLYPIFAQYLKMGNCGEMAHITAYRLSTELQDVEMQIPLNNYLVETSIGGLNHMFVLSCTEFEPFNPKKTGTNHKGEIGAFNEEWVTDSWSGRAMSLDDYCHGKNHANCSFEVDTIHLVNWFEKKDLENYNKVYKFVAKGIPGACEIYKMRLFYMLRKIDERVNATIPVSYVMKRKWRKSRRKKTKRLYQTEVKSNFMKLDLGALRTLWEESKTS